MVQFLKDTLNDLLLNLTLIFKLLFLIFQLLQLRLINNSLLLWLSKARLLLIYGLGLRGIRVCLLKLSDSILSSLFLKILQALTA